MRTSLFLLGLLTFTILLAQRPTAIMHTPLPAFSQSDTCIQKGLSAIYSGVSNGVLIAAGGCNFPHTPAAQGGQKVYYDAIYILSDPTGAAKCWKKVGLLPLPMAYGVAVTTPKGMIIAGGCNTSGGLTAVYQLVWDAKQEKLRIDSLPPLPFAIDNMTGTFHNEVLYIAGGIVEGNPSNRIVALNLADKTQRWRTLPPFPNPGRVQPIMAATQVDGSTKIYLFSGFTPATPTSSPTVWTNGYSFDINSNTWSATEPISLIDQSEPISLSGGVAVAINDTQIIALSGVDKTIFERALSRPKEIASYEGNAKSPHIIALEQEQKDYLLHPAEWYRFNRKVLCFDAYTEKWKTISILPQTALAGSSLCRIGDYLFLLNGEIKPGIRTQLNWRIKIQ